jgi:hypothetical protein
MNPTDLQDYAAAIRSIESSGNYGSLGPTTRRGDRAYGAYQVMGSNIPSWTAKHYGQPLTPQQFLNNKEAQDAVFNGEFGGYVNKHGNPQDAASMWFTGRPLAQGGNSNDGYITGNQYVDRFNKALPNGGGALAAIQNAAPTGASMPPGALGYAANGSSAPATAPPAADNNSGVLFQGEAPNKLHTIGSTLTNIGASLASINNPAQANALRAQAKGIEDQMTAGNYTYQMGANGQLLRINKQDGTVDSKAIPDAQKEKFRPIMGRDANNNPTMVGTFNEGTGEYKPNGGGTNAAPGPQFGGDPNLEGADRLASMSPEDRRMAEAFRDGRGPPVTSLTLRNPKFAAQWAGAQAAFPGLDTNTHAARKKFLEGKAVSNPTSYGGLIQRSEIALDQLDKTLESYGKLGNTDSMLGVTAAKAENYAKSAGTEKGKLFQELKTNSSNAASDINSVQNGGRGTGAEREHIANALNLPYDSHKVQSGAVQAHLDALKSAIEARFHSEKGLVGEDYLKNDPDYVRLTKKLADAQEKANKLYAGDFSYVPGSKAPAAKAGPAKPPAAANAPTYQEGMTATGPNGAKIKFTNGQWVPLQ